jgi:NAD(P)-dependent dehydrogenase (short-subunit alcohol dehydrogenase family)
VTGGGSGIGRSAALTLAALGATVTVAGRTEATLKETAATSRAESSPTFKKES